MIAIMITEFENGKMKTTHPTGVVTVLTKDDLLDIRQIDEDDRQRIAENINLIDQLIENISR